MYMDVITYQKAKSSVIKCEERKVNEKYILDVLDEDGYYIGSCIPSYLNNFLELKGINDVIRKEYKKILKNNKY